MALTLLQVDGPWFGAAESAAVASQFLRDANGNSRTAALQLIAGAAQGTTYKAQSDADYGY